MSLTGAVVGTTQLPDWAPTPLAEVLADASSPPTGGITDISDDEVTEFLALIRE